MDPHLRLRMSPVAHPDAVVRGDRWRITVLTDGLCGSSGPTTASSRTARRRSPCTATCRSRTSSVVDGDAALEIVTERLRLTYDRGPFSPAGLSIQARGNVSNYRSVWRYGEPVRDLGGTARTLDDVDGRAPLEPGVVSR